MTAETRPARRVTLGEAGPLGRPVSESVAAERALRVALDGREVGVLACTPADLDDLALGFLFGEGYIEGAGDVAALDVDEATMRASARLAPDRAGAAGPAPPPGGASAPGAPGAPDRPVFAAYGTGCGHAILHDVAARLRLNPATPPDGLAASILADPAPLLALFRRLQRAGPLFRSTGAAHYAALVPLPWGAAPAASAASAPPAPAGDILLREDISRHSAIDKVAGAALRLRCAVEGRALLTSGRLNLDAVARAARLGVPLLASRSAPTDLAVDLARALGLVLIGFARGGRFNVY